MRIALVPSAYHPAVGGVETLSSRLAAALVAMGHEVEVWTHGGPDLERHEVVDGIPVSRLAFPLPQSCPAQVPHTVVEAAGTVRQLGRALRRFRPDVLHVQCFSGNGAWALGAASLFSVPLVVTLQGETVMDDSDIYQRSTSLRWALRSALRRADVVTGCSQFTLDHAQGLTGVVRPDAVVVFNGTDPGEPATVGVRLPYSRYLAAVGRVVPKKGFDLLLDAFAYVGEAHPGVGLVIGGRGRASDDLARHAVELGLAGRVQLTGVLRPPEVAGVMAGAEVVVMPSRVEPFGIVALEAWRSGRPVVVTSRGGAPEFVRDGVDGLVADPFDRRALAGAISRLLDDPGLGAALAAGGRRRLADFAWPVLAARYLELYETARRHRLRGERP